MPRRVRRFCLIWFSATQKVTEVLHDLAGDGPTPIRNSSNRRLDTGNGAINTPEFLSAVFYLQRNVVNLDGKADPGVTVVIY